LTCFEAQAKEPRQSCLGAVKLFFDTQTGRFTDLEYPEITDKAAFFYRYEGRSLAVTKMEL
jgi:hypothetical protein